jgi:hypothetical protein
MTRNGKIARLPAKIREQVNARLKDGQKAGLSKGAEHSTFNIQPPMPKSKEPRSRYVGIFGKCGNIEGMLNKQQLVGWRRGLVNDGSSVASPHR